MFKPYYGQIDKQELPDNTIVRNGIGCYLADIYFSLTKCLWAFDKLDGNVLYFSSRSKAEVFAMSAFEEESDG